MFKPSKNPKVEELTKSIKSRSVDLSRLNAIHIEPPDFKTKAKRLCAWCAEGELRHGNQKYCSSACSDSAMAWAYPQKEHALKYLLMRQDWKCNLCQFDYRPFLDKILEKMGEGDPTMAEGLFWYHFKWLKNRTPAERKPEVDHIVPIYKGGESLGLANHQAICYTCHKAKTSKDLKKE